MLIFIRNQYSSEVLLRTLSETMAWMLSAINPLIVSITKLSTLIGSPRAYHLSRNQRAITWVSNYRCPILTHWKPIIGVKITWVSNYNSGNNRAHNFKSASQITRSIVLHSVQLPLLISFNCLFYARQITCIYNRGFSASLFLFIFRSKRFQGIL